MSAAVMLSDVAKLVMGQSPPSSSYNDIGDGLPFYQGKTDFGATYPTPRIYCRELRKRVTFAIFAEIDDLDRVTAVVEGLFTVLEKAGRT